MTPLVPHACFWIQVDRNLHVCNDSISVACIVSGSKLIETYTAAMTPLAPHVIRSHKLIELYRVTPLGLSGRVDIYKAPKIGKFSTLALHWLVMIDECSDNSNQPMNAAFTPNELKYAIKSCKNRKAAGPDDIPNEFIKNLPESFVNVLLMYFNSVWSVGILPRAWKHAIVLPIRKPDKPEANPLSYRPISLTSSLCKVMEKLVTNRLVHFLESRNLLSKFQTGFRKNRSTLDQIIKLQDSIAKSNSYRGFTVAAFLDFEKAYDMLWRAGLMTKVKRLGIDGNMFSFIDNFISERSFQVKVGSALSEVKQMENGTPQGSIISPTLFLIMINDMDVGRPGVELSLFADDSSIYRSGRNVKSILKDIQAALDNVSCWCAHWGMKISTSKSTAVIFTHRLKFKVNPLKINNVEIKFEDKAKFLGIIFDKRLNWSNHFQYIVGRCKARLNLMRSLVGTAWGGSKTCLMTVYRALIRSLLDYGAEALDSASQYVKAKFDSIQYQALKICCGAMRGTALSALQNECGEPPLALRRRRQQLRYCVKIKSLPDHTADSVLKDHWSNYYGKFKHGCETLYSKVQDFFVNRNINKTEINIKPPWTFEPFSVDTSLTRVLRKSDPELKCQALAREAISRYDGLLHVYTDGSKDEAGRVACSVCIPERNVRVKLRLSDNLSVYTAELAAIYKSLEIVSSLDTDKDIVIFTDSLSSAMSIDSGRSAARSDLVQLIYNCRMNIPRCVTVVWIPSHVGIAGNETADKLAKEALQHTKLDLKLHAETKEQWEAVDKDLLERWQEQWAKQKNARHNHQVQPNVSTKCKFVGSCRRQEVMITQLRLGVCSLNHYLHRLGVHSTGLCEYCDVQETIEHYLLECEYSCLKYIIKAECKRLNIKMDISSILSCNRIISAIYDTLCLRL